ncbi:serum/glucocorticoid-regulated kinase 3 [Schistosoma bovis]|uniref:Serum/glucocorticoid-regulated kinase 3 n=1 Tax=Schistosoma bovis TaxID=6184 RepID=A0A430QKF7_SCHBO|nr:serum/glucocorticoid-regulated kinase 3 [Schistosoma bovis]
MSVSVVGISDHATLIHGKRNTKFIIHLKANNQEWSVTRHYTEFHAIYTKLRESEDCTGLQLPGNNLLGVFTNRRKGLYKFVKKLVSTELLIKNEDVRLFLDLHKDKKLSNLTSSQDTDLIDLGPTEDKKASLDDFEIVKTIGEGNFGKNFERGKLIHYFCVQQTLHRCVFLLLDDCILCYIKENYFTLFCLFKSDLKPENILLDSKGYAILTDFGLCKQNSASQSTTLTFCGTPEFDCLIHEKKIMKRKIVPFSNIISLMKVLYLENLNKLNYFNNIINNNVRYEISDSVICSVMRSRNLHGIDETFSGFSYIPTKNIHN